MRHRLRVEWRAVLGLAVVVAIVSSAVLAFAAGARRTLSAPERYLTAARADRSGPNRFDALVTQFEGAPRTAEVAALPGVVETGAITFVFGGVMIDGAPAADLLLFAGSPTVGGLTLVEGRLATGPQDAVVTRSAADAFHLELGDPLQLLTYRQATADSTGLGGEPDGPSFTTRLVGIVDGPGDGDPTTRKPPMSFVPPELLDGTDAGFALTLVSVRLAAGSGLEDLRAAVDGLAGGGQLTVEPIIALSESVQRAVRVIGQGLSVLAAAAALAAIAALGQLVSRRVRVTDVDRRALGALGATAADVRYEAVALAAVPLVAGSVGGALIALAASGSFPFGFAGHVEPQRGMRLDPLVHLLGAPAFALIVLAWVGVALAVGARPAGHPAVTGIVARGASAVPDPATAVGMRFAFRHGRRDRGTARAAATGLGLIIVGLAAALVVGSGLQHLVSTPGTYGQNFEFAFGAGQQRIDPEVRDAIAAERDVAAVTLLTSASARYGGQTVELVGVEQVTGSLLPPLLAGRNPTSPDEVALGRVTARRLGVGPGDAITLEGDATSMTLRVVGLVVVPGTGAVDGVGEGAVLTVSGMAGLTSETSGQTLIAGFRPGAPADTFDRLVATYVGGDASLGGLEVPVVVTNLGRVVFVPRILAVFLGVLALLTAGYAISTATRSRARDIAVLRALGATRRWSLRAQVALAVTFVIVPVAAAAPVGVGAGVAVFRPLADAIGARNGASVPFRSLIVTGVVLAALIAVVGATVGRRGRRATPGAALRAE